MISLKISKFCKERSNPTPMKDSPLKCYSDSQTEKEIKMSARSTSKKLLLKQDSVHTHPLRINQRLNYETGVSHRRRSVRLDLVERVQLLFRLLRHQKIVHSRIVILPLRRTTAKEALKKIDFDKLFQGDDDISKRDKRERPVVFLILFSC